MPPKKNTYSYTQRKKITEIINSLTVYKNIYDISKIIAEDTSVNYTVNNCGVHIVANNLSDETFHKINNYLKNNLKNNKVKGELYENSVFNSEEGENVDRLTDVKLSSKEKKIIKRIQYASMDNAK